MLPIGGTIAGLLNTASTGPYSRKNAVPSPTDVGTFFTQLAITVATLPKKIYRYIVVDVCLFSPRFASISALGILHS